MQVLCNKIVYVIANASGSTSADAKNLRQLSVRTCVSQLVNSYSHTQIWRQPSPHNGVLSHNMHSEQVD